MGRLLLQLPEIGAGVEQTEAPRLQDLMLVPTGRTLASRYAKGRQEGMALSFDQISRRVSGFIDARARRSRETLGALVLGLAALAFARLGDWAQLLF